jgi:hypothetical protein
MWELLRKRQQYQQVRKPKVADCGMDRCCTDEGSVKHTTFSTPVITIESRKERFNLSPNRRRHSLHPAAPLAVAPSVNLDPKTINGDICLLTDSPYRILRVSDCNWEWRSFFRLTFCAHQNLYSAKALLRSVRFEAIGALRFMLQLRSQQLKLEVKRNVARHEIWQRGSGCAPQQMTILCLRCVHTKMSFNCCALYRIS